MSVELVVVGLGYVGAPLAVRACEAGLATVGFDISDEVVDGLNAGRSHVDDVSDDMVTAMLTRGFRASGDPAVLSEADTIVLCVPTGLTQAGEPDLTAVRTAARTVAAHLRPGTLVVLESTSYPGTTEEVLRPILENGGELTAGEDFHLVYSPERIDPGNTSFGVRNIPKVIAGSTPLCTKYGVAFYGRFVDTLVVSRGTREAEMAKLVENASRYVNIALVNEVARFCHGTGIDVWDVLHCAGTKPFGFVPHRPGPGVGGHCIPVDPLYLAGKARSEGFSFAMLSAARQVNDSMPDYVVARAGAILEEAHERSDAKVLVLGASYKPDVADTRESPVYPVVRGLFQLGTHVRYHDPGVAALTVDGREVPREEHLGDGLRWADLAVLLQDHTCYDPVELAASGCRLLDTRGRVAGENVTLL